MGDFRLIRGSRILIDAQSVTEDSLIPRIDDGDEIDISRVRWVLVIEKEVWNMERLHIQHQYAEPYTQAVFHRLARVSYHTRALAGEGIMVTVSCISGLAYHLPK